MLKRLVKIARPLIRLPAAGIDISDLSVKHIKFSLEKRGISFDSFGQFFLPAGIVENGEIKNEAELIRMINEHFRKDGLSGTKYVAASLPEEKSFLRVIQMPRVKMEEIAGAIKWELEANVPLSLEELYFDYEIIQQTEESADHYDVLIIAFPKTLVDSYLRVLKGARFIPTVLELEAQSIARSIIKDSSPRDAFVIIDMGATRTTFIIFAGGTITFTLTIEFGGKDMHSAIAEKMKVSLEEAERLKKEIGLNKKEKNGKVYEALLSSLRPLVNELERELGYYEQHFSHRHGASQKITRIYLCGGEANLIGLVPYLTLIFKTPVVVADPLINIKEAMISAIPPFSKNQSLTYTTAIGLALRTIQ